MTRAHLADPHIARKIMEGREHAIRPCVGMGYCIDFDLFRPGGLHPQCRDGPRGDGAACGAAEPTGRAAASWWSAAGPGGLEAARVAGERGHEVLVFEAASQPGGQIRLAAGAEAPPRDPGHRRLAA